MLPFVDHIIAAKAATDGIPVQVQAALIAAAVSLLTVILSETFLRMRTRRTVKQTIRETYQKYADPLAISSTDLFWRLREAFDDKGSGFYLKGNIHLTRYEHYKALSTLYRIANTLGWIRALRRELLFLPRTHPEGVEKLESSLQRFALALAEGGHVEKRRVESLIGLWDVGKGSSADAIARAGIQVDRRLKSFLHEHGVSSASDLSGGEKLQLSQLVSSIMTEALGCQSVADAVISETCSRTMVYLSIREAWIYRDWQAAVGGEHSRPAVRLSYS